jgi:tetratricopeptide (TPR) repeat protein
MSGFVSLFAVGLALQVSAALASAESPRIAPQLEGMGDHTHKITTQSETAQRYFDQGLVLSFGFNHKEAARSFRQAQALDPDCAMCYWGEALALGPNINAGMDAADNPRAYEAVQRAVVLGKKASARERAYVNALTTRYSKRAPDDRSALDQAYAKAMGDVARRFPDDADASALYAEALMDTTPWDYWEANGAPKPVTKTILATLEKVLAKYPRHPLANHLYIHAVEKQHPEKGVAAADRLRDLVPGAGHLVHMPGHIYIRVGRYQDAVVANEKAIVVDDRYIAQCHAQGIYPVAYLPHNHHFLSAAAAFIGQRDKAIKAARHIQAHQDPKLMREPDLAALQHYWAMPFFALVRFGAWNEILAEPQPAADLLYPTGVWRYARGMAQLRKGRLTDADGELRALTVLAEDPEVEALKIWGINSAAQVLRVAEGVLAGELAAARGKQDDAIRHLEAAVATEDRLQYQEPSDWYTPSRQNLGAVLLSAGRAADAERVYRADLAIYPENGWSLLGLAQSLEAQGMKKQAAETRKRFERVWAGADVPIAASRF